MKNQLAIILALTFSPMALAQDAFKCKTPTGYQYQDRPCKVEAPKPATVESATDREAGRQLCFDQAPKFVSWKDPEGLRVLKAFGGKIASGAVDTGTVNGRQYFVSVNGKNSFGGYVGERSIICYTSDDGTRILGANTILLNN